MTGCEKMKNILKQIKFSDTVWILIMMAVFLILKLAGLNIFTNFTIPAVWFGILTGGFIRIIVKKERDISLILFCSVFLLNYFVFYKIFDILIDQIYIFIFGVFLIIIWLFFFKNESKKNIIISTFSFFLIVSIFFSINYMQNKDFIIKDKNFREIILDNLDGISSDKTNKETLNDLETLGSIEKLHLFTRNKIVDIDGIENLKNLKSVYISEASLVKNFDKLSELENLEKLVIWYGNLNNLNEGSKFDSLEHLEILYPKKGTLENLDRFPNISYFLEQGITFQNLDFISENETIETLSLNDGGTGSFNSIEKAKKLKEINFYDFLSNDFEKILEVPNLKIIKVQGGNITNDKEFMENFKDTGVTLLFFDRETGGWSSDFK